jgi:DNA-binding MarR family transcriptional regulator
MSESNDLYASVEYIRHKVDAIENIELLNLRSNKALYEMYIDLLKKDEWLLKVYKEIDGIKSQKVMASKLTTNEAKISRRIKTLLDNGLIEIKNVSGNECIYKHSVAEKAFKLTGI